MYVKAVKRNSKYAVTVTLKVCLHVTFFSVEGLFTPGESEMIKEPAEKMKE